VTLATLAIHAEAWLQEELGVQRSILDALARIETAARAGSGAELAGRGHELERAIAATAQRESRRAALLAKLASALGLAAREVTLSGLFARLAGEGIEIARLESLRSELREAVTAVLRTGRRLAAVAQYHRGFFEELCQLIAPGHPDDQGRLVDARVSEPCPRSA
jgi:hypothetical protein